MDQSVPPGRVRGICIPPCSKSYAQRALAASLLAEGTSRLHNIEFCDDTRSAIRCIEALGARVRRTGERTLEIDGGLSPAGDKLYVGQSGLSTRLFTPIASLCDTPIGVVGEGPLLHRSFRTMIRTLRALGVRVHDRNDHLPLHIQGPIRGGEVQVEGLVSSQFITGLLLALPIAEEETTIHVPHVISTPYIDITIDTAERFGIEILHKDYKEFYVAGGQRYRPAEFEIESDWSAAAFLLVAGAVAGEVTIRNLSVLSRQADTAVMTALIRAGASVIDEGDTITVAHRPLQAFSFDATQCPGLFPALAALAASAEGTSVIKGTSRLENKEGNRAESIREEYAKLGIEVDLDEEDTMKIRGGRIRGGHVHSHDDHRIAMSLAVAALNADTPRRYRKSRMRGQELPRLLRTARIPAYCGINGPTMPTRREIIARIETPLTALYGEREARQIARIVVMELGGLCLTDLVAEPDKELGIDELDRIIGELAAGRPLQYVLGHTEFYGLDFQVREGVLIPRPETEELVRWIAESPAPDNPAVLDVGTGSGCIAVTLARLIPESRITAVDISEKALSIARENARRLDAKVDFRQGDALGELFPGQREQFDLIVSNPPYIPRSEKASIRVNVTGYEPAEALFVEDGDPLIFYRAIARNARRLLRPGGRLYFEIHENFADETFRMLTREGFPDTAVRRDLNDKNRMTCSLQRR